jgi:hypothetical protein
LRLASILGGIALGFLAAGCDQDSDLGYAPDDCHYVKPQTGHLLVQCTIATAHPRVPLTIYGGTMESGVVVLRDTLDVTEAEYELRVGPQYTVVARYVVPPDTVLVVDAARLEVDSHDYEDATCYFVETKEIDVRLRN